MLEIFTLSQAPIVVILGYIYFRDTDDKESISLLLTCFIGGAIVSLLAGGIELYLGVMAPSSNVYAALLKIVFGIALVEEFLKYLVIRWAAYFKEAFNEPYDGIMYSVAASLGFAALENFLYVLSNGVAVGWMRMFTAVPLHAMTGILMGFFLGMAKFTADTKRTEWYHIVAVSSATLAHGIYNYLVLVNIDLLLPLTLVVLLVEAYLCRKALRIYGRIYPKAHAKGQLAPEYSLVFDEGKWTFAALIVGIAGGAFWGVLWAIDQSQPNVVPTALLPAAYNFGMYAGALAVLFVILYIGLKKGKAWAWALALITFLLLLPTPCFPLGLCGLYGLIRGPNRQGTTGQIEPKESPK